jgi:hypothetical protein
MRQRKAFTGRDANQVENFIRHVADPIRRRYANDLRQSVELKV